MVSIFKIQCNEYFCLQNYEKTVRNKHIKTHIVLLADFCDQNCEFPMIQIKTYFYHFDLLSFDPLSFDPLSFDPVSFDLLSVNQKLTLIVSFPITYLGE